MNDIIEEAEELLRPQCPARFREPAAPDSISALTWNVSAVNNNPFEYWLSYDDPKYNNLMIGVEQFLSDPGADDVEVKEVFTQEMFNDLLTFMGKEERMTEGLSAVQELWSGGSLRLSERKIIAEFIQDKSLGAKRLISMPDRVTNTINVVTHKESVYHPPPVCRPSVMNNYEGDLSTVEVWWYQWKKFMFQDTVTVPAKKAGASFSTEIKRPVELLEPIMRSKYPAITEEEERISIPLQILCQAVFDAIIVYIMNKLSPDCSWQIIKSEICDNLYRGKTKRTVNILADKYALVDVICVQEAAAIFSDMTLKSSLAKSHAVVLPTKLDTKRNQNSLLLLSRRKFDLDSLREVTAEVASCMPQGQPLADGDLIAVEVKGIDQRNYLIMSFHGDTNGLMTVPLIDAINAAYTSHFGSHCLIVGMDANVYEQEVRGKQGFDSCIRHLCECGLTTCWGDSPVAEKCRTTCSARTFLQPQLNKAVPYSERITKGGMDPKDLIIFRKSQLEPVSDADMGAGRQHNPVKDNTGVIYYREDTVFPTLDFPSDHGILAACLRHRG
jgi:hypothetical protein